MTTISKEERAMLIGIKCPHCGFSTKLYEEATKHDAKCEKHPAVIRAEKAEALNIKFIEGLSKSSCPLLDYGCVNKGRAAKEDSCYRTPQTCWIKWAASQTAKGE